MVLNATTLAAKIHRKWRILWQIATEYGRKVKFPWRPCVYMPDAVASVVMVGKWTASTKAKTMHCGAKLKHSFIAGKRTISKMM